MGTLTVNLDGISTEIKRSKIGLKQLILDIENPRIQYFLDTRLNDNVTQEKIKFALAEGNDQYDKLKEHIERNGGIYRGYKEIPAKFTVLEDLLKDIIATNERAIVWTSFVENITILKSRLKQYNPLIIYGDVPVKERADAVKAFQESEKNRIKWQDLNH